MLKRSTTPLHIQKGLVGAVHRLAPCTVELRYYIALLGSVDFLYWGGSVCMFAVVRTLSGTVYGRNRMSLFLAQAGCRGPKRQGVGG